MKCFGWVYKSKLSVYQEDKVNSQSVAFSHKVCRKIVKELLICGWNHVNCH